MKRWSLSASRFWEEAPFFRLLMPLITGILLYDLPLLEHCGEHFLLACTVFAFFLFVLCSVVRSGNKYLLLMRFLSLSSLLIVFSLWHCSRNDIRRHKRWFAGNADSGAVHILRVADPPVVKEKTVKLTVEVTGRFTESRAEPLTGRALIYVYKDSTALSIAKGDTLLTGAIWKRISNRGYPFEFDYASFCARRNIYHQQFVASKEILLIRNRSGAPASFTGRAHDWCMRQLDRFIKDTAAKGLMQAMLIGEETNLDPGMRQAYSETGIVHVVSISGSHVAVFFLIVSGMLFWVRKRRHQWIKLAAGVLFVWLYVLVAGAPPSAVRAAMMCSILAAGTMTGKEGSPLNTLLAAAFLLLVANPMWLYAVGFQLSFTAVLSIIVFYKPVLNAVVIRNVYIRKLWSLTAVSIAVEILVAPLVIRYFHLFPASFIVANLVAVLLMGVVLYAGVGIILLSWLPQVALGIGSLLGALVGWFNDMIYFLQRISPASFARLQLNGMELALVFLVIVFLSVAFSNKHMLSGLLAAASACVLLVLLCMDEWKALHQRKVLAYFRDGRSRIELIEGKTFCLLQGDTSEDYTVSGMHTGWHAWREKQAAGRDLVLLPDKKVVITADAYTGGASFPADVVLLQRPLRYYALHRIYGTFRPQTIVACGNEKATHIQQWRDSVRAYGIRLHVLKTDGPFIAE